MMSFPWRVGGYPLKDGLVNKPFLLNKYHIDRREVVVNCWTYNYVVYECPLLMKKGGNKSQMSWPCVHTALSCCRNNLICRKCRKCCCVVCFRSVGTVGAGGAIAPQILSQIELKLVPLKTFYYWLPVQKIGQINPQVAYHLRMCCLFWPKKYS